MLKEDIALLDAIEKQIGVSRYVAAIKAKSRRRLEVDVTVRQKRKSFPWSKYKRLYEKQAGKCAICAKDMRLIRGTVEIDHKNPNAEDFNSDYNLQLAHKECNREKGGKSLAEQAKFYGKTTVQLLSSEPIEEDV
jgi:5-methylcytosine-specific restriction endonuclease McrA